MREKKQPGRRRRAPIIRAALAGAARAVRRFRERPPQLPTLEITAESRSPSMTWHIVPDWNKPAGGIRKQYRLVDILNDAGIGAAVVHRKKGFRCDWFDNSTVVVAGREAKISRSDVLVVPEIYWESMRDLPKGMKKVVLNQNAFNTLDSLAVDFERASFPYLNDSELTRIAAVSEQNCDLLRSMFPGLSVHRLRWAIDEQIYFPSDGNLGRRIAYMPRRRAADAEQLFALLKLRGLLSDWSVVRIGGQTEREAANLMRSSRIFLSFSEREGFGLPPLEAMACGCHVIGFTGFAGNEYFRPPYATPIEDGDIASYARELEKIMLWSDRDSFIARSVALRASEFARSEYGVAAERRSIVETFSPLVL